MNGDALPRALSKQLTVPVKGHSAGITGGGVAGLGHTCGDESGMQTAKRGEGGQWKRRGG